MICHIYIKQFFVVSSGLTLTIDIFMVYLVVFIYEIMGANRVIKYDR